jgi:hypothetical protein
MSIIIEEAQSEEAMNNASSATAAPPRRWPLFLLGVLLFFLGPIAYFVQISQGQLWMPWYTPILASAGVLLMLVSVVQRPGIFRIAGLMLFALLCAAQWFFMLVGARSPEYTGPAQAGAKIPAFATALADGQPFTDKDLAKDQRTLLVFYRGRW